MSTSAGTSPLARFAAVSRFAWLLMAAAHGPALASSWTSLAGGGEGQIFIKLFGFLALLVAEVFFALKVLDVSFLRLSLTRNAWIALLIGAAFLHVDLLPPMAGDSSVPNVPMIVATTIIAGGMAFGRRPLPGLAVRTRPKRNHCQAPLLRWASASVGSYCLPGFLLASRLHAVRGPPA